MASVGAAGIKAAAAGETATATAAVTAATATARHSAGRHRRHAERRGRRDRNDVLRIEVSPFSDPRPFVGQNSPNRRLVAYRAFLTKKIAATVAAIGRVSIFAQTASSRCRRLPDY
jgi:hypothetical protein